MQPRERLLTTLQHKEPDRVPIDLAGTHVTGISVTAYKNLRAYLGFPPDQPFLTDKIQQICLPSDDILDRYGADVRGVWPRTSSIDFEDRDDGEYLSHVDEWGLGYRIKKAGGLWYDLHHSPLANGALTGDRIENHTWPDGGDPSRFEGLREQAESFRKDGYPVAMRSLCAGLLEMATRIRGMENYLMELVTEKELAGHLLDKILEIKMDYWETALDHLGDVLDILVEADDFGTQASQLISPRMFRDIVKPRQVELIQCMREKAPDAYIFFHSCGNVRDILPDFIEMGIDILNPVHFKAEGMEPQQLKKDFGKDIVFWGGGIDTQETLPQGKPGQVREEVNRQIDILGDGGGFVFNTVHNIQADVPAENIEAMFAAVHEAGRYQ
ncbi:MAG TPA: uroporphyrinogen decarboxylase family protein [bacterium]|nr:uroporphyrinogen decarboxylase family protein [bacterium]